MDTITREIEKNGFAAVAECIPEDTITALTDAIDSNRHGARNLLANSVVREFAGSHEVRGPLASVLGSSCFAVRGIFFNKNSRANWKVSWHQDCVIAVREKVEIEGWGPWSRKAGVTMSALLLQSFRRCLLFGFTLTNAVKTMGHSGSFPVHILTEFCQIVRFRIGPKKMQ